MAYDAPREWQEVQALCVVCPDCAFTFDFCHEDEPEGGYSCSSCAEVRLGAELVAVRAAHDAALARLTICGVVCTNNERTIATLEAERAQLRMLLKESLGQLARIFETTKVASPDYTRLVKRAEVVLGKRELSDGPN